MIIRLNRALKYNLSLFKTTLVKRRVLADASSAPFISHDTCQFSWEWEQLARVSALFDGAEQLSMKRTGL